MNKKEVVHTILESRATYSPKEKGIAFAPSNIALCKYWGKRNSELNLPLTSSLSISLGNLGSHTTLELIDASEDYFLLNGIRISQDSEFARRAREFLDLFRPSKDCHFKIDTHNNIPTAAGLASSASGFASLVLALDDLFQYQLSKQHLSILARLGSGSACRSLWHGFVEWEKGSRDDGMDSFGAPIDIDWPKFCIGLLIFETGEKSISSREAMKRTVETSSLYKKWPEQVAHDLALIKQAIQKKDFKQLGETAEANALAMHATMLDSHPSVNYSTEQTLQACELVKQCRRDGVDVYFTQDAGPNLKVLFLEKNLVVMKEIFHGIQIVQPF